MKDNKKILNLISSIQESFIGAEQVYTEGSCYWFCKILQSVFPKAQPMYLPMKGHAITKIGNEYYDINGIYKVGEFEPIKYIDEDGIIQDYKSSEPDASKWKFNIYDIHVDCPKCGEEFFRGELEDKHIEKTKKRYD